MNLTKKSLIGLAALAALALGGVSASAATVGTATPKGKVTFSERTGGGDGNVTLPETVPPEVIKPEVPNESNPAGALMITNAPDFDFGSVNISSTDAVYPVKATPYFTVVDGAVTTNKVYKSPMVQIEDVRTNTATQAWSLAVSATPFATNNGTGAVLAGAEIRINKGIVYNNSVVAADQKNPAGLTTTTGAYTLKSTPQTVLSAAAGKGNGKSTLVMDASYKGGGFADGSGSVLQYDADSRIEDVALHVPVTAVKEKDELYTSTISWTLSDTPETVNATN